MLLENRRAHLNIKKMAQTAFEFSPENVLQRTYLFYCSVLILKMVVMSILTSRQRIKHKAFISPEDYKNKSKFRVDENVERIRRAHLNDLENIPAFLLVSYVYTLTNPSVSLAINLFRVFAGARFLHTFVYAIYVIPQPARAISFAVGFLITVYMAIQGILFFK